MSAVNGTLRPSEPPRDLFSAPYLKTPLQLIRSCGLEPDAPIIDVSGADSLLADALLAEDVTHFHPPRRYTLWHDNGEFDLLTYAEERQQYVEALQEALRPEGHVVISTYGPEAPHEWRGKCYSAITLTAELGSQFELMEYALHAYQTPRGEPRQYLHCRFCRHAPH
jgi:SAM-dependent methyltransferase